MSATLSPPLTTQNMTQSLARGAASGGGTILLVTYHWPPDATVGAVRPVKLAKYLGEHGWRTVVLTVGSHYYEDIDPEMGNDSSEYVALRTRCLTSPLAIYGWVKSSIFRLFGRDREFKLAKLRDTGGNGGQQAGQSIVGRVRGVLLSLFFVPDQYHGWLPFAVVGVKYRMPSDWSLPVRLGTEVCLGGVVYIFIAQLFYQAHLQKFITLVRGQR